MKAATTGSEPAAPALVVLPGAAPAPPAAPRFATFPEEESFEIRFRGEVALSVFLLAREAVPDRFASGFVCVRVLFAAAGDADPPRFLADLAGFLRFAVVDGDLERLGGIIAQCECLGSRPKCSRQPPSHPSSYPCQKRDRLEALVHRTTEGADFKVSGAVKVVVKGTVALVSGTKTLDIQVGHY